MQKYLLFILLLTFFIGTNSTQAANYEIFHQQIADNQPIRYENIFSQHNYSLYLISPVEPQKQQKAKKRVGFLLKKNCPNQQNDSMFPNSFAWTGVILMIIGILMGLIFGGTLGTIATVLAAIGLIFVVVWIIQRLSYM
jgi:fatty-acid desaturase